MDGPGLKKVSPSNLYCDSLYHLDNKLLCQKTENIERAKISLKCTETGKDGNYSKTEEILLKD